MGCDIHTSCYDKDLKRIDYEPFDWRSYDMYSFLAGVRNYSNITPISEPRGEHEIVKCDYDDFYNEHHSHSYLFLEELLNYPNYETIVKDVRANDREMTLRQFLGEGFFDELEKLKNLDVHLICFDFDN